MAYPLAGLKVLDMSRVLAGPFAGRMLADLGADVVKVEPPAGDLTRLWGAVIGGVPGYYHQQNVGKRNICVDLAKPGRRRAGQALGERGRSAHRELSPRRHGAAGARLRRLENPARGHRDAVHIRLWPGRSHPARRRGGRPTRRPFMPRPVWCAVKPATRPAAGRHPDVRGRHQRLAARPGGGAGGVADAGTVRAAGASTSTSP